MFLRLNFALDFGILCFDLSLDTGLCLGLCLVSVFGLIDGLTCIFVALEHWFAYVLVV